MKIIFHLGGHLNCVAVSLMFGVTNIAKRLDILEYSRQLKSSWMSCGKGSSDTQH